jgi:BASS family bile acid:Na+ symporter
VIGTHALFSKNVQYKDLALAIIDEQHRFGVMQRSAILDKGRTSVAAQDKFAQPPFREPNLLMMSATPIPQTLALTVFGDLDVLSIHTMPSGRKPVITYLSKGDTALSIGMTSINTLLAPFLTPLLTYLYLRTSVDVDIGSMFMSIIQVVIIPIGLGLVINRLFEKYIQKIQYCLPAASVTAICLIVAAVVSHNSEKILSTGLIIFVIVILHNLLGYLCGYLIGILFKMNMPRKKAVSIEIGMQNSGLATSLASTSFPNMLMATVPGAIFSVWHNISGAILAAIYRRIP